MKFIEFIWLCKQKEKVRSNQASISINSYTELSKTQLFPVNNVKEKNIFPFYVVLVSWFSGYVGKTAPWKMKNGSYFPNQDALIRTLYRQESVHGTSLNFCRNSQQLKGLMIRNLPCSCSNWCSLCKLHFQFNLFFCLIFLFDVPFWYCSSWFRRKHWQRVQRAAKWCQWWVSFQSYGFSESTHSLGKHVKK